MLKLSNCEALGSELDVQSPSVVSSVQISSSDRLGMFERRISIASSLFMFFVDLIPMLILSF